MYKFYATLLDGFQNYLDTSKIYQEYWGNYESPSKTEDEFEKEQFQSLIDRINRVPFDSEPADKGTAFNEVIDCIIHNAKSNKMEIKSDKDKGIITVNYNNRTFEFDTQFCRDIASYFTDALSQVYTEGKLQTKYGEVILYGFIDELLPFMVHDIKTTSKYKAGKFKNNWQHIVYPFCLNYEGNKVNSFEYDIIVLDKKESFIEYYDYNPERDIVKLTNHVERFIEFIENNRLLITDTKIKTV